MGSDTINDVIATIAAMEMALSEMGIIDTPGNAVGKAMKEFIKN